MDSTNKIEFIEETHTYLVDGIPMKRSVTQLVKDMFSEFDGHKIAWGMVSKPDFIQKYPNYVEIVSSIDMSTFDGKKEAVERIKESWEKNGAEAAKLGTEMHQSIEDYYNEGKISDTKEFNMFQNFDRYVKEKGYLPYKSEQIVYDVQYSLAGSVDMQYTKNLDDDVKKIWLVDWKRSKSIDFKSFGGRKFGKAPLDNVQDCNYGHYSLQLNIYKFLLEKHFNVSIEKMTLVILHPKQDDYMEIEVQPIEKSIIETVLSK
jgi:hypothetical protein